MGPRETCKHSLFDSWQSLLLPDYEALGAVLRKSLLEWARASLDCVTLFAFITMLAYYCLIQMNVILISCSKISCSKTDVWVARAAKGIHCRPKLSQRPIDDICCKNLNSVNGSREPKCCTLIDQAGQAFHVVSVEFAVGNIAAEVEAVEVIHADVAAKSDRLTITLVPLRQHAELR